MTTSNEFRYAAGMIYRENQVSLEEGLNIYPVPTHVAIIMDGNGRWAKERGLGRIAGHRAGTDQIRRVVESFAQYGVKHLTLYAFSTENWNRPGEEVRGLMGILEGVIRRETKALHKQGIRILHLGRLDRLSDPLRKEICQALELTKNNTRMTLSVAFDYGGRAEIIDAVRSIIANGLSPDELDEELFGSYLYSATLPDPDLIVRTAGEQRLSNFLLWQSAYSEYYYTQAMWPDFDDQEVRQALIAYSQRKRRFGKVAPQG